MKFQEPSAKEDWTTNPLLPITIIVKKEQKLRTFQSSYTPAGNLEPSGGSTPSGSSIQKD